MALIDYISSLTITQGAGAEDELRVKLDAPELTLDMSEIGAADVAGRARAFGAFIKAGMDPEDAARETGVMLTKPLRDPRRNEPPAPDDGNA